MISILRNSSDRGMEYKQKGYAAFSDQLIEHRKCKCDYCGFRSQRFMRLISENGFYNVFEPQLFKVACPFCFMVNRLDHAKDKAILIYLPEIEQSQLNMMMHALWYYSSNAGVDSTQFHYSNHLVSEIIRRSDVIEGTLGKDSHLPETMSFSLRALTDQEYSAREKIVSGFRLVPIRKAHKDEIEYWMTHVYKGILGEGKSGWDALAKSMRKILPDVKFPEG